MNEIWLNLTYRKENSPSVKSKIMFGAGGVIGIIDEESHAVLLINFSEKGMHGVYVEETFEQVDEMLSAEQNMRELQ